MILKVDTILQMAYTKEKYVHNNHGNTILRHVVCLVKLLLLASWAV
jgi:hypothetical protein